MTKKGEPEPFEMWLNKRLDLLCAVLVFFAALSALMYALGANALSMAFALIAPISILIFAYALALEHYLSHR